MLFQRLFIKQLAIAIVLSGFSVFAQASERAPVNRLVDTLLLGGVVIDGTGEEPYIADVGLVEGRLAFIGNANAAKVSANTELDVTGLWVTPGFIDMHSHIAIDEDYGRAALPYLFQGVTTAVLGVDGFGGANVSERFAMWRKEGIGINGALYVGHNALRYEILGGADRAPTPAELATMKNLVTQAMNEGALGLSTGLFYVPGKYSKTDEVLAVAEAAAAYEGAIYDTHDRDLGAAYEGIGYDASVKEAIHITEKSGLRGIFSHFTPQGKHNYGRGHVGAQLINEARARGVDIWAAHHPYTATQSALSAYTIPGWAAAGGRNAMVERFDIPDLSEKIAQATDDMLEIRGGANKLLLVDPDPSLNGKTLEDVANELGLSPALTAQHLLRTTDIGVMNLDLYDINNIIRLGQEPWMLTGTDGGTPSPGQVVSHPRAFGAFPRKFRLLTVERSNLKPEFIIRSFSGLAADFLNLTDRGYVKEGFKADIVVLDPKKYQDKATYDAPQLYASGIQHVFVNGVLAVDAGIATGALAGTPIARSN